MTKTIDVEITGVAPLLQHRFATEEHGENKSKAKTKVYDPKTRLKNVYTKTKLEKYSSRLSMFISRWSGLLLILSFRERNHIKM